MMNKHFFSAAHDKNFLVRWWWSIDRWSLISLCLIILLSVLFNYAASPSIAHRLGIDAFFFVHRHIMMLPIGVAIVFLCSLFSSVSIRRFSACLYIVCIMVLGMTMFWGVEIKGAKRWLMVFGMSIQPSEFIKPAMAIMGAWVLAEKHENSSFPGIKVSFFLLALCVVFLLAQPDLGMTLLMCATWGLQLFASGLHILWIISLFGIGAMGLVGAYVFLPHVSKRIDQFFDPRPQTSRDELYQVQKSLEAFQGGGWFGRGPGEGVLKKNIPDAHADFIFSVVGEEFGFVMCMSLLLLFGVIIVRSLIRSCEQESIFVMLSVLGLSSQFGLQVFINMSSALHLIPTKGMTMPFISYGGSSLLAVSLGTGMLFSLTRKRHGTIEIL